MNLTLIYILIAIAVIYAIYYAFIKNTEGFEQDYEYDVLTGKDQQQNMLVNYPYQMYLDGDTKEKLITNNIYGSLDEFAFDDNSHIPKQTTINTSALFEQSPKWGIELSPTENVLNRFPYPRDFAYSNNTYCGSFGNQCGSTFDCCGGLQCVNRRCQQI